VCIAVGADGTVVMRKTDESAFTIVPTHVHTWLSSVALNDGKHAVITGGLGHLLHSENAGQSFGLITGE
jgi:hypothetical protein